MVKRQFYADRKLWGYAKKKSAAKPKSAADRQKRMALPEGQRKRKESKSSNGGT